MRVILLLLGIGALCLWAGFQYRKADPLAATILFLFSGLAALGFIGAFFGWFGA